MQFIDTHAHLYDPELVVDIDNIIEKSLLEGVQKVLMPNIDIETIEPMLHLAEQYPDFCLPMLGIHPCYIQKDFQKQLYQIESWLSKKNFIALGEIGIDLYKDKMYQSMQIEALQIQLELAKKHNLPIAIHSRNAFAETIQIISKFQDGNLRGVFHCFSGTLSEAEQIIALGFHLGIGGIITFKTSSLGNVISNVDLKHVILETDSPYLAPSPYRGKTNDPSYLPYIADAIAVNKKTTIEIVASVTTANAKNIFKL